jgi:uncharacterized SAM-binding protein YcdF (DUF218 family)
VLTGGGAGPVAEAEIMRRAALARGVPEAALLIEAGSRNTFENARETARLLGSRGLRSVVLVSDRAHLLRAAILFRFAGLRVAGWAGVRPPSIRWEARVAIHEFTALPRSLIRALLRRESRRSSAVARKNAPANYRDREGGASDEQKYPGNADADRDQRHRCG